MAFITAKGGEKRLAGWQMRNVESDVAAHFEPPANWTRYYQQDAKRKRFHKTDAYLITPPPFTRSLLNRTIRDKSRHFTAAR